MPNKGGRQIVKYKMSVMIFKINFFKLIEKFIAQYNKPI